MECENGFKRDPDTQCQICQCNEQEEEVLEETRNVGNLGDGQCGCMRPMSCEFGLETDSETGCEICR